MIILKPARDMGSHLYASPSAIRHLMKSVYNCCTMVHLFTITICQAILQVTCRISRKLFKVGVAPCEVIRDLDSRKWNSESKESIGLAGSGYEIAKEWDLESEVWNRKSREWNWKSREWNRKSREWNPGLFTIYMQKPSG